MTTRPNIVLDWAGNATNTTNERGWSEILQAGPQVPTSGVPFDLNNDGFISTNNPSVDLVTGPVSIGANPSGTTYPADDGKSRQLLARHLYVLMMLLKDDTFVVYADLNGDGYAYPMGTKRACPTRNASQVPPQAAIDVAYYFAQWAVNIVDFRDQDAVMTPFEFDIFPFVDNDPTLSVSSPLVRPA